MNSTLLLLAMFLIGSDVWACECPEGREDECETQFEDSIDAECERMVSRGIWRECTPWEEIDDD